MSHNNGDNSLIEYLLEMYDNT
ncbi:unnamed protein product, partial [Rotaria sordida]